MTPDLTLIQPLRDLLQAGQAKQALEACQAQLTQQPSHPDLRLTLALCHEALGEAGQAEAVLDQLLSDQPEHVAGAYHRGRLHLVAAELEAARQHLNRCIALDPNHAAARTLLAKIQSQTGDVDQAISTLRTALRADAKYVPALAALAHRLLDQGELTEAHELAAKAVQLRPQDPQAQWVMAQVFAAEGHDAFAHQALSNAAKAVQPQQVINTLSRQLTATSYRHNVELWQALDGPPWALTEPAPEAPSLMVVAGWPGEVRDQWIKDLIEDWGVDVLPVDQASQRRSQLNLPVSPESLAKLSPTRLRRQREAYLQGLPVSQHDWVLEPLWLEAAAMPALMRLFPSLTIVWLDADLPAGAPPEWGAERAVLAHAAGHCGVRWVQCSPTTSTVETLAQELGLPR
jgi:tetratricopeptide (TPR) repeat protein